ncbi:hypothetical protein [Gilvimarinus chinensis]|nr:hypothetical protein [Gilvimarinus chinensis]
MTANSVATWGWRPSDAGVNQRIGENPTWLRIDEPNNHGVATQ